MFVNPMPSPPNLSFEPLSSATPEVCETLCALHETSFSEAERWTHRDFLASVENPQHWGVIGKLDGDIVGYAVLLNIDEDCAEILTILVAPKHQRSGIGRAVLEGISETLAESGRKKLFLEVAEDNQPAISTYDSCGFTANGRRKQYYSRGKDKAVDAILMIKPII